MTGRGRVRPAGRPISGYPAWIADPGSLSPVILSTRARLARNLAGFRFPHRCDLIELHKVARLVGGAAHIDPDLALAHLRRVDVHNLSEPDKAALVDAHLISLSHATAGPHRIALIDYRSTTSIMVNEEDHVRIQVILPGLQTDAAWRAADRLDDLIALSHAFAYTDDYGYLAASMANTGTGLRVSVMVHVPALTLLGRLPRTLQAITALGATVRGLYGEFGAASGDVYQVSNGTSLGRTERDMVGRLNSVANFVQSEEISARDTIHKDCPELIENEVKLVRTELDSAVRLTSDHAMRIISLLRLGQILGVETSVTHIVFCELIASMRATIGELAEQKNKARDVFYEDTRRPALIRNKIRDRRG